MTRIALAALAALTLSFAAPVSAQEINIRSMDQACRTDPALQDRCFVPPAGHSYNGTIGEFVEVTAETIGVSPEVIFTMLVTYNGWDGATYDTIIPAGTAFRTA